MAYTPAMLESIARVEASRGARMTTTFPRLTPEQRELQELAHDFAERELRPIALECDRREETPPELLRRAARADERPTGSA